MATEIGRGEKKRKEKEKDAALDKRIINMIKDRNQKRRPAQNDNDRPAEKRRRTDEDGRKNVV